MPGILVEGGAESAIAAMEKMLRDASISTYARRVPDPAEALTVLLIESKDPAYWPPMLGFLTNESLTHAAKERSFNLLADNFVDVSDATLDQYRSKLTRLTVAADPMALSNPRESGIFPPAVRFAGVYGLLDESSVFSYVCTLASSKDRKDKLEAARTVTALAARPRYEWLETLALQLSHEIFSDVRVEAIKCLSFLLRLDRVSTPAVVNRLLHLLDSDGTTVPLSVLKAIPDGVAAADPLREKALTLRVGHISRKVRDAAASVFPR